MMFPETGGNTLPFNIRCQQVIMLKQNSEETYSLQLSEMPAGILRNSVFILLF